MTTSIGRWVAGANELNSLEPNKLLVGGAPESILLSNLSQESNNNLSTVLVLIWKIYLITKHDKPLVELLRSEDDALRSLLVVAVLVEGFQDEVRPRRRGEVDEDHFHVGEHLQGGHERHGLSRAWRTTKQEWSVLAEPATEHLLMTSRVDRVDDSARISDFARIDLNGRHSLLPQVPLLIFDADFVVKQRRVCLLAWHFNNATVSSQLLTEVRSGL